MGLGFPPLQGSYPDYVRSLIASFGEVDTTSISPLPVHNQRVDSLLVPVASMKPEDDTTSPSLNLSPFWLVHLNLRDFLLVSAQSFTTGVTESPVFTVSSIDDPLVTHGVYQFSRKSLAVYRDKAWSPVRVFDSRDLDCDIVFTPKSVYFRVR
uniref:Uncharacterized protein n=1 Tax=Qingyuan Delta tick virus 1 TaxID=2972096 RepID=A0A9E7V1T6_9VIRU|nr:MAG: hypothetical protein [Qingyuan Delta tick virus 1]